MKKILIISVLISTVIFLIIPPAHSQIEDANLTPEQMVDFWGDVLNKSKDNPNKVFLEFETKANSHARSYTDSNGQRVDDVIDHSVSYVEIDCPPDRQVIAAIAPVGGDIYSSVTIFQNGNMLSNRVSEGASGTSTTAECQLIVLGGCLIATATFGSELAPQVQMLREIRDNSLLQTQSGSYFMESFNQFYYSFSPTIADLERESPVFKEAVKLIITPLLSSLSLLNYVDMDSESEVLGYGISLILLNVGMYFVAPAVIILTITKNKWRIRPFT